MLATGSVKKPIPALEFGGNVIGTEEAWALSELPASMVVIGAGASGTEIASAYARLGTQVTLYEGLERVLPTEDADISKLAERVVQEAGHRREDRDVLRRPGGRLGRHRRRPRARRRGRSGSTRRA